MRPAKTERGEKERLSFFPENLMNIVHRLKFPAARGHDLGQDEAYFYIHEGGEDVSVRFHDYDEIYKRPQLYEQLFYDRLQCSSPEVVGRILAEAMTDNGASLSELRVLDLGAGNGMMGEELKTRGVARLVGADIIPEARDAAYRDRPHVYDDYYVADFGALDETMREELESWHFDCLTSVAALGFGDIPPHVFLAAMRLIKDDGWLAFNIKETFLDHDETSGFSRFIRELIFSKYLDVHHLLRYRHRLSMEGVPLYYYALIARKKAQIPADYLSR